MGKNREKESDRLRRLLKEALAREKAEAKFQAASPAEKRVIIAKDVLAQVAMKKLVPANGHWLRGYESSDLSKQLDVAIREADSCSACAAGAIFACAVMRKDDITISRAGGLPGDEVDPPGIVDSDPIWSYLRNIFPTGMLDAIETAFERGGGATYHSYEAAHFAPRAKSPKARMVAIMNNIIENKGDFIP